MTLATTIQTVTSSGQQINPAFPIAGQDNNTQGFRDNFSKTQSGLEAAGSALDELNTRTPKLDSVNDYENVGTVGNAILAGVKGATSDVTINGAGTVIDIGTAEYFRIKVNDDCTNLKLSGWPNVSGTKLYRKVRLEFFQPSNLTKQIKFIGDTVYNNIKYDDLATFDPSGVGLTVSGDSIIVDAWVSDNSNSSNTGVTIYLQLVGTFASA